MKLEAVNRYIKGTRLLIKGKKEAKPIIKEYLQVKKISKPTFISSDDYVKLYK